jgi:hypothetical protein
MVAPQSASQPTKNRGDRFRPDTCAWVERMKLRVPLPVVWWLRNDHNVEASARREDTPAADESDATGARADEREVPLESAPAFVVTRPRRLH